MSTIKTDTLSNLLGTKSVPTNTVVNGSAKAWVNFNGTGTVAIRAAFNVSSITDNGTGDYTVNFAAAFADVNFVMTANRTYAGAYTAPGTCGNDTQTGAKTTTSQRMYCVGGTATANITALPVDPIEVNAAFFR